MKEKYLVVNGGSSSLKFSLYEMKDGQNKEIVKGLIERIGIEGSCWTLKCNGKAVKDEAIMPNHEIALQIMLEKLKQYNFIQDFNDIIGVGHRVVHGGEHYADSVVITEEVLNKIESVPFAPNHTPGQVAIIKGMLKVLPKATQVSVFDTAFHQTMPEENYIMPIPYEYYEDYKIRKYGFHGTSHKYITERMKEILKKDDMDGINIISCHMGNGVSISPIENDKSLNNTMGLTPSDGVLMGTRTGAIDPGLPRFICNTENINMEQCENIFNKKSGLLGISGISSDIRDLTEAEKQNIKRAKLALTMFENSIAKQIAASFTEFNNHNKIDAIVFTAGIGENVSRIRENIIKKLAFLGIKIDEEKNNSIASFKDKQEGIISASDSKIPVYVIPTNEELMILKDTIRLSKEYKNIRKKVLQK